MGRLFSFLLFMINQKLSNFEIIKKYGMAILLFFTVLETIFFFSFENILGCAVFIYAWYIWSKIVFLKKNFDKCFLPTLGITGYIFCYYFLPLVATFLEGKPLTHNFQVANLTFFNMFLNVTTIFFAYKLCLNTYKRGNVIERLWETIGFFKVPTEKQVWIFGIVGCALLINIVFSGSYYSDYEDIQIGQNLSFVISNVFITYAAMPICLYFTALYGYNKPLKYKKYIIPFIIIMSLIGVAATKRSLIFNSLATIVIIYLFIIVYNNRKIFTLKNIVITFFVTFLLTGPAADLALAMILNRMNSSGGTKTFDQVIELYQDKDKMEALHAVQKMITSNNGDNRLSWSEDYVDNIFLSRFCNIRVLDASVFYAKELGYDNPQMHKYFKEEIINRLPSFIVALLGEKKVVHTTVADEMNNRYFNGGRNFWAGWKVSGDIGVGLYTFGYKYYPIALIIYFLVFSLLSTYTKFYNGKVIIPVTILCGFYLKFVYFDNAYGIYSSIAELLRGWVNVIVYCAVFKIIRICVK